MLQAILIRHSHPNNPDWVIIDESVPLGTTYECLGFCQDILLASQKFGTDTVDCLLLKRDGDTGAGWLPQFCFRLETE